MPGTTKVGPKFYIDQAIFAMRTQYAHPRRVPPVRPYPMEVDLFWLDLVQNEIARQARQKRVSDPY